MGMDFDYHRFWNEIPGFQSSILKYSNEAVIAFYILHQPVILCIGYFVIQWPVPDAAKWIMISLTSFAGTMLLYEYIVRRFDIFRFLFGMKLKSTRISDNK